MANPFTRWPPDEWQVAWLAGLMEGEGSFWSQDGTPHLSLGMNDQDVVGRAADLMGVSYHAFLLPSGKTRYQFMIKGRTRAGRIMGTLHALMGERRQVQIEKALRFPETQE
jgi:hypothetical protein